MTMIDNVFKIKNEKDCHVLVLTMWYLCTHAYFIPTTFVYLNRLEAAGLLENKPRSLGKLKKTPNSPNTVASLCSHIGCVLLPTWWHVGRGRMASDPSANQWKLWFFATRQCPALGANTVRRQFLIIRGEDATCTENKQNVLLVGGKTSEWVKGRRCDPRRQGKWFRTRLSGTAA